MEGQADVSHRNYTGPSKSLTYEKVNDCRVMPYDTIGSIWIPDSKIDDLVPHRTRI